MKIVYFTHSLQSCWNHGNAHFLRGVLRELVARGHEVMAYEPLGAWSLVNLLQERGPMGLDAYHSVYPELRSKSVAPGEDLDALLDGADLVVMHEWNEPALVGAVGARRREGGRFTLLFHDTHHRAVSDPDAIRTFDLSGYDGVLAFGEALRDVYRQWGWGDRVWTWHEAADIRHFHPPAESTGRAGAVWIGNWGDDERTTEIEDYLLRPMARIGVPLDIFGVRYPREAQSCLWRYGAAYRGWLPNADVPSVFARALLTVHVPRRFYASILPGIPTIRVFEALACGLPLVSAPWDDRERLFRPGTDFLMARNPAEMSRHLKLVAQDAEARAALARAGLETIRARHTCGHRAEELLAIVAGLAGEKPQRSVA